jgi:hypothetical protein
VLLALAGAVHGCLSPSEPTRPPGGGHVIELDYAQFAATVEPALQRRGCDAGGDCHGGGIRGTLELSPASAKDVHFDFDQIVMQVDPVNRESSAVLRRPLALNAGGTPHPYKPFATTTDTDYVAIHAWIMAGVVR